MSFSEDEVVVYCSFSGGAPYDECEDSDRGVVLMQYL